MMTSRWLRVTSNKRARAYALVDHDTGVTHLRFAPPTRMSTNYDEPPIGAEVRHSRTVGKGVRGDPMRQIGAHGRVVAKWKRGGGVPMLAMQTDSGCTVISAARAFWWPKQTATQIVEYGDPLSPPTIALELPPPPASA